MIQFPCDNVLNQLFPAFFMVLFFSGSAFSQPNRDNYLLRIIDESDRCGYVDMKGDTIIQPGKYIFCYTDTVNTWAAVMTFDGSIIAIDRDENKMFNIYQFDNGPDYPSDGLFRIIKNGRIGYASTRGEVVIKPKYACAMPFNEGRAKVSKKCRKMQHGEHSSWESDNWFFIDTSGKRIDRK